METVLDSGYSWLVLVASFCLSLLLTLTHSSHGIYLQEFTEYFGVSKADASVFSSLTVGISGLIGIVLGPFANRFGIRVLVIIGGILTGLGTSTASFANSISEINMLYGVLPGIGTGCYVLGEIVALLQYFKARRTLAFGIAVMGYSAGSAIAPVLTRFMINTLGLRGTLLVQGGIQFNAVVCGALLRPQSAGEREALVKDHTKTGWRDKLSLLFDLTVFEDVKFWLLLLTLSFNKAAHYIPYVFLPSLAQSVGVTKPNAAALLTLMASVSGIFRLVFGFVGDYLGIRRTLLNSVCTAICGGADVAVFCLSHNITVTVYAGIFGLFCAGYMTLDSVVTADIVPEQRIAHATGFCMFGSGLIKIALPPIAGYLVDITGSFAVPFLLMGIIQLVSGLCYCIVYILQLKENNHKHNIT